MESLQQLHACIRTAAVLEATTRKPGNVHPGAAFADCDYAAFVRSAEVAADALVRNLSTGLGEAILAAVLATQAAVSCNTNLGIVVLFAPLVRAAAAGNLRDELPKVLAATTVQDSEAAYTAIRLANPGGLGTAKSQDVHSSPTVTLGEAMRLASDRDALARQYTTNFADVFAMAERFDAVELPALERQVLDAFVTELGRQPDTLISRKHGSKVAADVSARAAEIMKIVSDEERFLRGIAEFDLFLRVGVDGRSLNPGATADLVAAALLIAVLEHRIPLFTRTEIARYAAAMGQT